VKNVNFVEDFNVNADNISSRSTSEVLTLK